MNKKHIFYLVLSGLIFWSPILTSNANAQRPNVSEEESPFPNDGPVTVDTRQTDEDQPAREPDKQMVMINSRFAGWEEASREGGDRVGERLRGNWIMVDSNGHFHGKVTPGDGADAAGMNIFLMNKGRLVKQTSVDKDGQFEFNNVRQGAYSLIGWGDKGFFAFGMNILANNPKSEGVTNELLISAFQNRTTINTDWIRHFSARVGYRVFGIYPTGETAGDEPALYGFYGLVNHTPKSTPATSISSHRVAKTADGGLLGRVHQMNSLNGRPVDVRTTKVMLLQGDDVVASTTTDNFGVFEFKGVPDGNYAVAAAGVDGVGLIGINVGGTAAMNDIGEFVGGEYPIDFTLISSETMGWLNHYASEVSYRRALLTPRPAAQVAQNAPAPYFGGAVCSSCQNQPGGCNTCQNQYLLSTCRSRGLTFEQWQQHCQGRKMAGPLNLKSLGNGELISIAAERIRKNSGKVSAAFDKAFYPDTTAQQLQQLQQLNYQMQQQQNYLPQPGIIQQQNFAPQQNILQQNMVPQLNMMPPQNVVPQLIAPPMNEVPMVPSSQSLPPIVQPIQQAPSILKSPSTAASSWQSQVPPIVAGTGSRVARGGGVVVKFNF